MMVNERSVVLYYTIHAALPLPATYFCRSVERIVWMVFIRVVFVQTINRTELVKMIFLTPFFSMAASTCGYPER